jgi:iron complex transport system ATP-binding protein
VSAVTPLLECAGLCLSVGREARALLRDAAFAVQPGELWCLIGPNGVGKTTLLHALAGLRPPQGGEVRLCGRPLGEWPLADAARRRGFLPQVVHDAFSASVLEVVMIGRHPHIARWQWEGDGDRAAALAALQAVELEGFAERDVLTLSGGERQRVALAALLAQEAPLYLLDEPLAHLDLHHQVQVLGHLRSLAATRNTAMVMSVHDLNLAVRFASHALVFMPGGRVLQGAIAAMMTESVLSEAFGHRIVRGEAAGQIVFVAE